jgi:hypothetical protein
VNGVFVGEGVGDPAGVVQFDRYSEVSPAGLETLLPHYRHTERRLVTLRQTHFCRKPVFGFTADVLPVVGFRTRTADDVGLAVATQPSLDDLPPPVAAFGEVVRQHRQRSVLFGILHHRFDQRMEVGCHVESGGGGEGLRKGWGGPD